MRTKIQSVNDNVRLSQRKQIDKFEPEEKARISKEKSKPTVEEFFKWCEMN